MDLIKSDKKMYYFADNKRIIYKHIIYYLFETDLKEILLFFLTNLTDFGE